MDISRRDLHKGLLSLLLLGAARAEAAQVSPGLVILNRLTFGATPQNRTDLERQGLSDWLDAELAKPATDPALDRLLSQAKLQIAYGPGSNDTGAAWDGLDEMRHLNTLNADTASLMPLLDFEQPVSFAERIRPADEVKAASLIRAVNADAQLRELMTAFWHEHFSVNAYKDGPTAVFFPAYDRMLRGHAFGNFRMMLGDVATAPAMLSYLNNDASRASPANENFARELLELHTLGVKHYFNDIYDDWRQVPGATDGKATGYIDQDVYEVARAFTGWSIGDGRGNGKGIHAPLTGAFHYVERWHDPYQKRVLSVEFPPNRAPLADGEQVLDMLAAHPATAHHVAGKLLLRLGIESPSADYHAAVAARFHALVDDPDQIAHVLRTIVLHDEFQQTPPSKLRRPFEYLAGIYRASGAHVHAPTLDFDWHLGRAGWTQHAVKPPTGHPDHTADWANTRTLQGLIGLALYAHEGWMGAQMPGSGALREVTSLQSLAQRTENRFGVPEGTVSQALATLGVETLPDDRDGRVWVASVVHAAAALHPQFVLR
ncbi:DUF1800 domain-containing protein [Yoonia sp. SS1-5]|uniref:DUF1800 domain-containing protein n=1 Tax=Yoonia rhodophyticola TaxID=3137370 RepID=A0AAN0MA47_9RHOB